MEITKQQFYEYLEVQQMGAYNMLDPRARELTSLTKKEWIYIIKNYIDLDKDLNKTTLIPYQAKNLKSLFQRKYPNITLNGDKPYIEFHSKYADEFGDMKVSNCLNLFYNYVINSEDAVDVQKCL